MQATPSLEPADIAPLGVLERSLRYFDLYRTLIAILFVWMAVAFDVTTSFGVEAPTGFYRVALVYLFIALGLTLWPQRWHLSINTHLTVGVVLDIAILSVMMHMAGGARSVFGYLLLVVLAGAGLVGQGRMTLFHAALATLALLTEQLLRVLDGRAEPADFFYAGIMSLGFFVSAASAQLLASRVVANEALASRRGQELEMQLHLNQRVIRDMQDGVFVTDKHGNVRQYNPQAASLFNFLTQDDSVSLHLADFSVTLAERFRTWCGANLEHSEILRISHPPRLLRVRFLPPGARGNALLYIEDMDRVQAQSQQIKLAALGRLAANMAHEIRNPLAAISHAAELIEEDTDARTLGRLARIIGDNTQRLNRIVVEVLELGRRDRTAPETINLRFFLHTLLEELALNYPNIDRLIEIEVRDELQIAFDRGHLYRVLSNLLQNALRYCSNADSAITVSVLRNNGRAELHVSDDGPGISDELRGQVFEPFFTTHASGTGLGLYIARELCEANGAELKIMDNKPGAHFCIVAKIDELDDSNVQ